MTAAAADGSTASDLGGALEPFRTAGATSAAFEAALVELLGALRGEPGSDTLPSWAAEQGAVAGGATELACADESCAPRLPPGSSASLAPSTLRAQAPEFQPCGAAAATSAAPPAGTAAGAAAGAAGAVAVAEAAAAALGGLAICDQQQHECGSGIAVGHSWGEGSWQARAAPHRDPPESSWEGAQPSAQGLVQSAPSLGQPHPLPAAPADSTELVAAFLGVLSQQFPEYSHASLAELLEQQGGSLEAAAEVLCSMESEVQGQAALGGPSGEAAQVGGWAARAPLLAGAHTV